MSKQRCLLILLLLVFALPVLAVEGMYVKTSVLGVISDPSGWTMQNRFGWDGDITTNLSAQFDSDFRWSDRFIKDNPQKAWHSGSAKLKWQAGSIALQAAYRNTFYGSSAQAQLYPQWVPLTKYDRSMQHQTAISADWNDIVSIYAMNKHLRATPYTFDFGSMQYVEEESAGLDDFYAGIGATWRTSENLNFSLGADYKDGTFADSGVYQVTSFNAIAEAQYPLSYGARINGSIKVEHREGDFLDNQRTNVLRTRVRLQKRIINDLSTMLVWENNTCFDNSFSALRLISNYLRLQAVFNLGYDASVSSYIMGGGKYSPENDATAIFADTECLLAFRTYAGCGTQWIPEKQSIIKASLTHRFMQNQDVRLVYNRVNNLKDATHTDYLGVSTGFWW